jgi:hypothetical protein
MFHFIVQCKQPASFTIKIRRPTWAVSVQSSIKYKEENGFLVFYQLWGDQTHLTISFAAKIVTKETPGKEVYFENGPLVLCHTIDATQQVTKRYAIADMHESVYSPIHLTRYQYNHDLIKRLPNAINVFTTLMLNPVTGKKEMIKLVPMAKTILRQVTFKINE